MGTSSNSIACGGIKAAIALLLLFAATVVAFAQGQVVFANFGFSAAIAPISDVSGDRIIGPSPYVAHLFWSVDTNATMDSLAPIGADASFLSQPITNAGYGYGYFFGGAITFPVFPPQNIVAQVRVWNTNYASTYYEARDKGGDFGFSNLVIVEPIPPPGTPDPLIGLQSFQLQRLPHLSIARTPTNTLSFSWPTNITTYALQQDSSLDSPNWTTLTNTPVVVGSQNQVILLTPQVTMFYRLISQ